MQTLTDLVGPVPPNIAWTAGAIAALLALVLASVALWLLIRHVRRRPAEDTLTVVAASIATGVSAQGMWRFTGDVLGLDGPLRVGLFAFIEVAIVTSAVRARRNMRESSARAQANPWETPSAGIDGLAVWALTVLTAVLSCMDARSIAEGIFRLAAPLVAAWLWERGMAVERKRITGLAGVHWRITPERVLVYLGLAEAKDRTADEVDIHRRLTRVALAAKRVHQLRQANASDRRLRAAITRRDRALDQAVEHTDLARNKATQATLLDIATAIGGGDSITALLATAAAPWADLDHPAVTGAARNSDALVLAEETRRLTAAILAKSGRDPEASAALTSMAAFATGRHLAPDSTATGPLVAPEMAAQVAAWVAPAIALVPPIASQPGGESASAATAGATSTATATATSQQVADELADAEADEVIRRLRGELTDDDSATGDATETASARATEEMWRHWQKETSEGRLPTGAELARVGGCVGSWGRAKRAEWEDQMDGRTLRRLQNAAQNTITKKVTA